MWAGTVSSIPSGWQLCNGQNGAPDLRGLFIKGAAAGVDPGVTGGSATHSHTYTDIIQHTHAVSISDPGHTHTLPVGATDDTSAPFDRADAGSNSSGANATTASGSSATGVTATTAAPNGSVAMGTTAASSSEPAYYSLAFIRKT